MTVETFFFKKKEKTNKADFHFLISRVLHDYLSGVAWELNVTMRVLIETFVTLSIDQIDMLYQEYERQVHSVYELVSNGGTININIRLPQNAYENVKWVQGNFNLYSMAQVVRRCIFLMLILMMQYGGFRGAVAALRRLNDMTQHQQESRDEHGFMRNRMGVSQLLGGEQVSYIVIVRFMRFMLFWAYPPPQIGK